MESRIISKIGNIINVFETGSLSGNYANVTIFNDGKFPNGDRGMPQITYGSKQTTEQSNLNVLISMYVEANGLYSEKLKDYLTKIGLVSLVKDNPFIELLKKAGNDPIMQRTQDAFFEKVYMMPAKKWFTDGGFTHPLSMAIIFDSFIHSGKMRDDILAMCTEPLPKDGGFEKRFIIQYVNARTKWLLSRKDTVLQKTVYRMKTFKKCFETENWDLSQVVYANGVNVKSMFKMPLLEPKLAINYN